MYSRSSILTAFFLAVTLTLGACGEPSHAGGDPSDRICAASTANLRRHACASARSSDAGSLRHGGGGPKSSQHDRASPDGDACARCIPLPSCRLRADYGDCAADSFGRAAAYSHPQRCLPLTPKRSH